MSHDREHDAQRDHQHATTAVDSDATAPGRASRSAELRRTDAPLVSGILMRKANGAVGADHEQAVAHASAGSGGALPDDLRAKFESSLGVDLGGVRVHTGSESAQAASSVGAHAYALGNDIHFGAGQYDPSSERGQHLIAHEVAHTVQQRGAPAVRQNKLAVSSPGDSAEVEADHAAAAMVAGRPASISAMPSTSGILHRSADPGAPANPTSVSASGKISTTKTSFSVEASRKVPLTSKYVTGEASISAKGSAEVTYPNPIAGGPDVEASGGVDTTGKQTAGAEGTLAGPKLELYKKAVNDGVGNGAVEQIADLLDVQSVDVEPSFKHGGEDAVENGKAKTEYGMSVGGTATITFKGGKTATAAVTIVGIKAGETPSFSGPSASLTLPSLSFDKTITISEGVTAKAGATITGTITVKPTCTEELAKKLSEKFLQKAGEKAAEKATETAAEAAEAAPEAAVSAALDTAAMAEIAGFGAIAVSMGAALVIGANQVEAIKEYVARGERAIASYVAGAMTALGAPIGAGSDPNWFVQGQGAYAGKLNQMMAAVKSKLPAGHNLGDAEIMARLMSEVQANASKLKYSIEGVARPTIAKAFAEQYYKDQDSWLFKSEDRRDAERVALGLNQQDVRVDENGHAYQVDKDGKRIE